MRVPKEQRSHVPEGTRGCMLPISLHNNVTSAHCSFFGKVSYHDRRRQLFLERCGKSLRNTQITLLPSLCQKIERKSGPRSSGISLSREKFGFCQFDLQASSKPSPMTQQSVVSSSVSVLESKHNRPVILFRS